MTSDEFFQNSFSEHKIAISTLQFPYFLRLTSVISNQVLIEADLSRKKRKKKVDGIAANLILQNFLDREGK